MRRLLLHKRFWVRALRWSGGLLALGIVGLAIRIWTFEGRLPPGARLDAAVVLGAAAYGGVPSPVFAARLEHGGELLRRGQVKFVIVTGGGHDDPSQPEAIAGVRFLVERGADPARVLLERRSFTTPENLCFAAQIGQAHGLRSYAIVSDPLHLYRALRYARDLGLDAQPAATPTTRYRSFFPKLQFVLRETYIYARRLLLGPDRCRQ